MPDSDTLESLLVADIGSVNTKVGLVDHVGSEYRFVGIGAAATTAESPTADVMVGLRRALAQIETRTHRRFLTDEAQLLTPERASGQGVDAFAAITSAPLPLRVAIVGLSRDVSVASAAAAAHGTYATVAATLALDESGGRWLRTNVPQDGVTDDKKTVVKLQDPAVIAAETLAGAHPEVIVLVGGIDGGATTALYEMANLVAAITAAHEEAARPTVIFAGNREARAQIAARLGPVAPLRVVDNIHPALDRENPVALQRELESLYVERKIARLPGIGGLSAWTHVPILPAARAFENVVRFLSQRYDFNVLGADIGGTTTMVATAHGNSFRRTVRADLGLAYSLENVLACVGLEQLVAWLPMELPVQDAQTHWLNRALRPAALAVTREQARLQQVVTREALRIAAQESKLEFGNPDLFLLTGGGFAGNSDYGALALLALDALQPRGVFTLAIDALGLAPAFGALAALNPEAAAHVIERDAFLTLGTVIAPVSNNREGQIDLRIQVQPVGSGVINLEVEHGSLELIPLAPGQKASLQVRAAPGVDLGSAQRGVFKAEVEGGAIGLIVDARGRPIALPASAEKRREKIQKWLWDVGS
ncbi:MAG: glutamate mutase L [Chloroflexi bacterium]|nr:glutamate mutase L [Chloroflexota bacterium]